MILLSILIPSLLSRKHQLAALLTVLEQQKKPFNGQVEIILAVDNKEMSTGAKRQWLLEQAKGEYVVFIDDDDEIYPCYISEMIKGCSSGADCLGINGVITTNGKDCIKWEISKNYDNKTIERLRRKVYLRHTNHITAVKRSIALQAGFPDKSNAEDKAYSDALRGLLHTEFTITQPVYHYKYSTFNKEYK